MADSITNQQEDRLRRLLEAYLTGELRPEDRAELEEGLGLPAGDALLQEMMSRTADHQPQPETLKIKAAIDEWLTTRIAAPDSLHPAPDNPHSAPVRPLRKTLYWIAAALFIALAGAFTYLLLTKEQPHAAGTIAQRYKNDLAPGRDKAILKLSDGKVIELDEKTSGAIDNQDGAVISRNDGWLRYTASKTARYNDLYTPVGAQIKLVLEDGTKVWLDASSSIHYPTAFLSGQREVTVTGQAYFDVAPNTRQPFIVHAKDQTIRVLGTQFNVNAYGSATASARTTLQQGSVLVTSGNSELKLQPGQQADGATRRNDVDMEEIVAWKNGEFRFNGASITVIMDQMARWYGADIRYKDDIKEEFVAKIARNMPLSKVLQYLEATGQVKFLVEGKTITVMK